MYSQQYDGYRSSFEIQLIPNVGYILGTNNKQDTKKSKLLFIAYLFSELLINEVLFGSRRKYRFDFATQINDN